nr:alanine--tRNA ligase [Bacilli bacterium]
RDMIEGKKKLEGAQIFKLYDTFGFPSDLTKEICLESGVEADMDGFEKAMEEQKERARNARGEIESFHKQSKDLLAFKDKSEFTYDPKDTEGTVIGLFVDGVKVDSIEEEGEISFDLDNFYAESGGQVSDAGRVYNGFAEGEVIAVSKAPSGQHLLRVHMKYGTIKKGDKLTLEIDKRKRELTARNHSATHLLHAAIGEVLGHHVDQKGSYVDENYLRFDYTALTKPTDEQLRAIEELVNEKIAEAIPEVTEVLPIEEAKNIGAEMEFSEKYGDTVRVVEFGEFSKEFCGGTHVGNSSDIGVFVIESEGAVASGIRRIQGRTSLGAYKYLANKKRVLGELVAGLGNPSDAEAVSRLEGVRRDSDAKSKDLEALKSKLASLESKGLDNEFEVINNVYFIMKVVDGGRNEVMKLGDNLKTKHPDYLIALIGKEGEKKPFVIFAGGKGKDTLPAGNAMKIAAPLLGGNGGGKPEMASGSAANLDNLEEAKAALKAKL